MLEKGITISGKPLKDHLEAIDHARALSWVLEIASQHDTPITEADIRNLHHLVMANSSPEIAGRYADSARYVNTDAGIHDFPTPMEVPALMEAFSRWLGAAKHAADRLRGASAPCRHSSFQRWQRPHGATLMNLVLARAGYPPIAIRPEDRPAYIAALEIAQRGGGHAAFDSLLFDRLDQTLDMYLDAARQAQDASAESGNVIPIRN